MKLSLEGIRSADSSYVLPAFDIQAMREKTRVSPEWLHFGAGNLFRAFPCVLAQKLLDAGDMETGLCCVSCHDETVIDTVYTPYDNLSLVVSLRSDGTLEKRVTASVAEALRYTADHARLEAIFCAPSLRMVSFTVTEKAYAPDAADPFDSPRTVMGMLTKLLYARYLAGGHPLALVSMDNCSRNGTILRNAVLTMAAAWRGRLDAGFTGWLENEAVVSFPWSMIDKITPRPSQDVLDGLSEEGFEDAQILTTPGGSRVSPVVNAEECEYLAIEDRFPNGRPPLEKAGVIFADRATVEKIERMKVCTCLNPLHTALAIFGCLLGYTRICDEMRDADLKLLVERIGYIEGLPVSVDPVVMNARDFLDELVLKRLPNPFMPDAPQRIACDTSKKIPIRFGETLKTYAARGEKDLSGLTGIALVCAAYARYLEGIGDDGKPFERSPDPALEELAARDLRSLFSDEALFGIDLYQYGIGDRAEKLYHEMKQGAGAIRRTLHSALNA